MGYKSRKRINKKSKKMGGGKPVNCGDRKKWTTCRVGRERWKKCKWNKLVKKCVDKISGVHPAVAFEESVIKPVINPKYDFSTPPNPSNLSMPSLHPAVVPQRIHSQLLNVQPSSPFWDFPNNVHPSSKKNNRKFSSNSYAEAGVAEPELNLNADEEIRPVPSSNSKYLTPKERISRRRRTAPTESTFEPLEYRNSQSTHMLQPPLPDMIAQKINMEKTKTKRTFPKFPKFPKLSNLFKQKIPIQPSKKVGKCSKQTQKPSCDKKNLCYWKSTKNPFKKGTCTDKKIIFYDDDKKNSDGLEKNPSVEFHNVNIDKDVYDDGGISIEELKLLTKRIKTDRTIKAIVFDWDRTLTCTEGLGLDFQNSSLPKNASLNDLWTVFNKQEQVLRSYGFDDVIRNENDNENGQYRRWEHSFSTPPLPPPDDNYLRAELDELNDNQYNSERDDSVTSVDGELNEESERRDGNYDRELASLNDNRTEELAQNYFTPLDLRKYLNPQFGFAAYNAHKRITVLQTLFNEAHSEGIFIFILTNNKIPSTLIKDLLDKVLNIYFPIEHILRGGTEWKFSKPEVLTQKINYKLYSIDRDNNITQYGINYLLKSGKKYMKNLGNDLSFLFTNDYVPYIRIYDDTELNKTFNDFINMFNTGDYVLTNKEWDKEAIKQIHINNNTKKNELDIETTECKYTIYIYDSRDRKFTSQPICYGCGSVTRDGKKHRWWIPSTKDAHATTTLNKLLNKGKSVKFWEKMGFEQQLKDMVDISQINKDEDTASLQPGVKYGAPLYRPKCNKKSNKINRNIIGMNHFRRQSAAAAAAAAEATQKYDALKPFNPIMSNPTPHSQLNSSNRPVSVDTLSMPVNLLGVGGATPSKSQPSYLSGLPRPNNIVTHPNIREIVNSNVLPELQRQILSKPSPNPNPYSFKHFI
jgi:hypothetical protein